MQPGQILQALLVTLVTFIGLGLLAVPQIPYAVVVLGSFVAVLAIALLSPLLWQRIDSRFLALKNLRKGVYAELYIKRGAPYVSIFRSSFNWARGRAEIYGVVFRIEKAATGRLSASTPNSLSDWRSHFINVVGENNEEQGALYFYRPSDEEKITGVTSMILDASAIGHSTGFFCDMRKTIMSSDVVPFVYVRFDAKKSKRSPHNKQLFNEWKSRLKRISNAGKNFKPVEKDVEKLIEAVIQQESRVLDLVLTEAAKDALAHQLTSFVGILSTQPPDANEDEVIQKLRQVVGHAHNPYSQLGVVAAVVERSGSLHFGVNVENASYPQGTCAEQSAISAMVVAGGRHITKVFLASTSEATISPCGGCLQRIAEFALPECEIVTVTPGGAILRKGFGELFPTQFKFRSGPGVTG